MNPITKTTDAKTASRRQFMKTSASLAVAGGAMATGTLASATPVHAAGSDLLRVGLIGCGGRGTGAAGQALLADKNVKLTAMADAFEDRLSGSLKALSAIEELSGKIDVPPEKRFVGFDEQQQPSQSNANHVPATQRGHQRPDAGTAEWNARPRTDTRGR